jgi:hypothetical protein
MRGKIAYCATCDVYLAAEASLSRRLAAYALSVPERVSRILIGSLGGFLKGTTELLLPEVVRRTKLYEVLLQRNLRYLVQELGDVEGVYPSGNEPPDRYIARKFLGNFMELAGILTMRASPIWILALVSDVSGGTRVFLNELTEELKREKLLDPDAGIETVDQLLDGLHDFSAGVADRLDLPPLSVEELKETLAYLRQQGSGVRIKNPFGAEEMRLLLEKMKELARRENLSLYEISSAIAMNTINQLERSGRTAVTGLRVGRALLDRSIVQYYSKAIDELSQEGYYRYLARATRPYFRAMLRHLAWKRITWTERYFLSRAAKKIAPLPPVKEG